jgi:hypothetical protein
MMFNGLLEDAKPHKHDYEVNDFYRFVDFLGDLGVLAVRFFLNKPPRLKRRGINS